MSNENKMWTVAGVWYKGEPLVVAVIEGGHPNWAQHGVDDLDESEDLHESWTLTVEAADPATAEAIAARQVLDGDPDDDGDYDPPEEF